MDIIIGEDISRIDKTVDLVIYSEAIPEGQKERIQADDLWIELLSYPEAIGKIANDKKLIAIAWSHWKSTTTAFASVLLKDSHLNVNALVWTLLSEFWGKNVFFSDSNYFVLEACEYKRAFLNYRPYIAIITNIDHDHHDCYETLDEYIDAFSSFIDNIRPWWYAIINWEDESLKGIKNKRSDIHYIEVFQTYFTYEHEWYMFPTLDLQIPWQHIKLNAKMAYTVWYLLGLKENYMTSKLWEHAWWWRRMEIVKETENKNTLISDYWHHPTEIRVTLEAIRWKNSWKKILAVFQPHQYARTIKLLEDFKNCFSSADEVIIPNIYASRDTEESKKEMNTEKFVESVNHLKISDWKWFENTIKLVKAYDKKHANNTVIVLLWAWNIDDLRYDL